MLTRRSTPKERIAPATKLLKIPPVVFNDPDTSIRWVNHDQFCTSLQLSAVRLVTIAAYFCPTGHRHREAGDVTGLQFGVVDENNNNTRLIGQALGRRKSEVTLEDNETIHDVQFFYRKKRLNRRMFQQVVGAELTTSCRLITWMQGGVRVKRMASESPEMVSEISWVFNAGADSIKVFQEVCRSKSLRFPESLSVSMHSLIN